MNEDRIAGTAKDFVGKTENAFGKAAGDAESRPVADRDRGDVLDQHRVAVGLRQHGVGEVFHRADQANAAHHGDLRAEALELEAMSGTFLRSEA